jgi:hypothetical protein
LAAPTLHLEPMKAALVLAVSFASMAHADSVVAAFASASITSTGGAATAVCSASGVDDVTCQNSGMALDKTGNPFNVYVSAEASGGPNYFELQESFSSQIGSANLLPPLDSASIHIGSSASYSDTITVTAPFSSGYLMPVFTFKCNGTCIDPYGYEYIAQLTIDGDSDDLGDFLASPSSFTPLVPFTSGQVLNFAWSLCQACFRGGNGASAYPGYFDSLYNINVFANLAGFRVLDADMQPYNGPVTFYSPTLPGIVPEPSTFALCVVAIGGLLLRRRPLLIRVTPEIARSAECVPFGAAPSGSHP